MYIIDYSISNLAVLIYIKRKKKEQKHHKVLIHHLNGNIFNSCSLIHTHIYIVYTCIRILY